MSGKTGSGPAIRVAGACDVALLAELYRLCFAPAVDEVPGGAVAGTPWSARSLAEVLALPGVFALLAVGAGPPGDEGVEACAAAPVGFLLAQVLFEEAELLTLGVLPQQRRAGHARQLLQAALAEAARRGGQQMHLEVAENNTGAQALYRGAGFTPTGRRRNYYRQPAGGALDAVIYTCSLSPPAGGLSA